MLTVPGNGYHSFCVNIKLDIGHVHHMDFKVPVIGLIRLNQLNHMRRFQADRGKTDEVSPGPSRGLRPVGLNSSTDMFEHRGRFKTHSREYSLRKLKNGRRRKR
ncbi:hypothetical protein F2P81_011816 [Scophthalmus maximus]|uniref:Uncharacterized protein n=1 Tax=Scophthalmus maximus TaxID=52904 RepID=A0A6A4SZM4_SCOMX|nr:hypothetical protein F2P81_011816 [Scophthalmus maximus]